MTDSYDGAVCPCGSAWFRLEPTDPISSGAVCLDRRGLVTGYTGTPVCVHCGDEWRPMRERLWVVE